MEVIVPLAGSDFIGHNGLPKALRSFYGQPLLRHALRSRPWAEFVSGYTFILKDLDECRAFASQHLKVWYPGSTVIFLSSSTRGAACSSVAGVACQRNPRMPLIIDLADILYVSAMNVGESFKRSPRCGGLALAFPSNNPLYSYLLKGEKGTVVQSAEKKVISAYASAGTYIFRDSAIFLRAVAHAFENEATQTHNGLFYVCPLFNGVVEQGMAVEMEMVCDVIDIKGQL